MTLTAARDTLSIEQLTGYPIGVKGGVIIYKGSMVAKDASGYALMCTGALTEIPLGKATKTVDATDYSSGDLTIEVEPGIFAWGKSGSVTIADVGKVCYAVDEQTITMSQGSYPAAGLVTQIEGNQVFVDMRTTQSAAIQSSDLDLSFLAASGGAALIGYGASTVSSKLGSLSTANAATLSTANAILPSLAASTGGGLVGTAGGSNVLVDFASAFDQIAAIVDRFAVRSKTIHSEDLAAISASAATFSVGAAFGSNATLLGWNIGVTSAFGAASTASFSLSLGDDSSATDITSGVDATAAANSAGTPGAHGYAGAPLAGDSATVTITSDGPLSAANVGDVTVKIVAADFT